MVVGGLGGEADPDDEADRLGEVPEGELAVDFLVPQGPAWQYPRPLRGPRLSSEVPWRQA